MRKGNPSTLHRGKTNMTLESQPIEDKSPTENGDFPLSCEFSGVHHSLYCWIPRLSPPPQKKTRVPFHEPPGFTEMAT